MLLSNPSISKIVIKNDMECIYHCVHGTSCLYTWSASALIELFLCQLDFFLIRNLYMEMFVYTCMCMCDQKTPALHLAGNKPSPKPLLLALKIYMLPKMSSIPNELWIER